MAQARRKRKTAKSGAGFSVSGHGLGMLLAGMVIGSLATVLWQGMRSKESDVGSGIRQMMESSRRQAETESASSPAAPVVPEPQTTNYDFFTVLPEIEVVVSADDDGVVAPPPVKKPAGTTDDSATEKPPVTEASVEKAMAKSSSAYMLQAGSYNRQADAERQKANLALMGLPSAIQKITIQGRGDFYRVRLGPYENHARMVDIDERLKQEGIQALRLKISRSG